MNPLAPLCNGWLKTIKLSLDFKKKKFQDDADECMKFVRGAYARWLYKRKGKDGGRDTDFDYAPDGDEDDIPPPTFQITINKAAELVHLFGPAMYQRNPDRKVAPREVFKLAIESFGDPMDQLAQQQYLIFHQQASQESVRTADTARLFEMVLNYTPQELNLRHESRLVVDEALIMGMSGWMTELVTHPSGLRTVGSFYSSVKHLTLDHDANRREDCMWMAIECCHPIWEVERDYNLPPDSLKGNHESAGRQMMTEMDRDENARRATQGSNDLIRYWKIWSKMGLGGRLRSLGEVDGANQQWKQLIDQVGDYCFLAVAPGVDYPLNVPEAILSEGVEAVQQATQWPTPFWLDRGAWPYTFLAFHDLPDELWPMPHLASALGEIKFVNWVYSFLASKIRVASRDILVLAKSLAEETKRTIKHAGDYSYIELENVNSKIDDVVKFIQHPTFNPEIYNVLDRMMELIDKRTGLTDLIYGVSATQLRSAAEANVKQQNATIRPDDMAQQVEDASSDLARREVAACRWHLQPNDVLPIVGSVGAWLWETQVLAADPAELFHQFEVGIESGSTKRPNKQREAEALQLAMNNVAQLYFQYATMTMDVQPFNALQGDWLKSLGLDPTPYLLKPLPPPMPPAPPGGEGEGGVGAAPAPAG